MTLLYVNDRLVDLKSGQGIAYTLKGISLGTLTLRWASITNQFTAIDTESNAITFAYSNNEKSTGVSPYRILPAKLVQNGVEFKGTCILQSFSSAGYKILFVDDSFDYFTPLKGKPLSEIAPITSSPWTEEEIDSNRTASSGLVSAVVWWGTGTEIFEPNLYLPSFYYSTLVNKVFEFAGLTPSGPILTDSNFTDLVVPFPSSAFTRLNAVDAPSFISKGAFAATTGGSFNFSYPSTVTAGNLLFLHVVTYGLGTVTVDGSWTSLGSKDQPTGTPLFASKLYYKIADGTETGSENVSRSGHSGTDVFMGQVYQYQGDQYGVDLNITVEDSDNSNDNVATITWVATTVSGGKRTLGAFVTNMGAAPGTPSGYTESATDNDGSNNYLDLNTKEDTNSGASTTATGGSVGGWVTWHVSIANTKQNVNWNQYFHEIKCDELLKDFFNRFGILYNITGTAIELKTIQAIISDRAGAVDWSGKLVKTKSDIDFGLKDYAQSNLFRYTDSEFVRDETLGEGAMLIDNDILKADQEKYKTFFENCRTLNTTGHLVARLPVYDTTSVISDDMVEAPGIKVLTLKARTSEPAITFDQTARTDYKLGYFLDDALAKDTGFQYFLDTYYPSFTESLQAYKLVEKYFYLTELDVYNFNRLKMVWDGDGYYLVDTIDKFIPGKVTKVLLFKVS